MPDAYPYLQWLQNTWLSNSIRDTLWFPAIETVHLLGLIILASTALALDLRLAGLWLRRWPVCWLMKKLMPWIGAGFGVMVFTGWGLFVSDPLRFFYNTAFRIKMLLIALAGVNALVFQITARPRLSQGDAKSQTPPAARIAGLLSILLWLGVITAGRWIGFVD